MKLTKAQILASSLRSETAIVNVKYDQSQIDKMRYDIIDAQIALEIKENEKKLILKEFNIEITKLKSSTKINLQQIRKGTYEKVMDLYLVPDYDKMQMIYYTEDGEIFRTRHMMPEEKQTRTIDIIGRTGTH